MAFGIYHSLVMTAPDDPAFENNPSDWNAALVVAGADVGGIPYCPTATTIATSSNFLFTTTSGPRLQVGSGLSSGTSVGWLIGYGGFDSGARIWGPGKSGSNDYALLSFGGTDTYLNGSSQVQIRVNDGIKITQLSTAGLGPAITAGTATTDVNALSATQTWNGAVAFKANKTVVTPTSYSAGALMESWEYNTGQGTGVAMHTELTTIAAAATTDTTITIPANVIVLGVSVRVTVVIPTAATFTVTGATSGTAFQTGASVSTAATTTDAGTKSCPYLNTSAQTIRITPNAQPADNSGRVRVTIHYLAITPPTS